MHCIPFLFPFFGYYGSGTRLYYGFFLDTFLCITIMISLENTEIPGWGETLTNICILLYSLTKCSHIHYSNMIYGAPTVSKVHCQRFLYNSSDSHNHTWREVFSSSIYKSGIKIPDVWTNFVMCHSCHAPLPRLKPPVHPSAFLDSLFSFRAKALRGV